MSFTEAFQSRTGVSLASIPMFVLVGVLMVMCSVPLYFEELLESSRPPALPPFVELHEALVGVTQQIQSATRTLAFSGGLIVLAQASLLLIALIPLAGLIRSNREGDWEPLQTAALALLAGLASFPALAWIARAVLWLFSLPQAFGSWMANLMQPLQPAVGIIVTGLFIISVVVVFLVWLPAGLRLLRQIAVKRLALAVAATVASILLVYGVLSVRSTPLAREALVLVGSAGTWLATTLSALIGWTVGAVAATLGVCLAIALLAQIGVALWKPLAKSSSAGYRRSSTADLAAGAGVALSIVLTATAVNPTFNAWFAEVTQGVAWGRPFEALSASWNALLPDAYRALLAGVFRGFTGFPEFAVIAASCLIGNLSLSYSDQIREKDGIGGVATLAVARTTVAVTVAIPLLIVMGVVQRDG